MIEDKIAREIYLRPPSNNQLLEVPVSEILCQPSVYENNLWGCAWVFNLFRWVKARRHFSIKKAEYTKQERARRANHISIPLAWAFRRWLKEGRPLIGTNDGTEAEVFYRECRKLNNTHDVSFLKEIRSGYRQEAQKSMRTDNSITSGHW